MEADGGMRHTVAVGVLSHNFDHFRYCRENKLFGKCRDYQPLAPVARVYNTVSIIIYANMV